MTAPEPTRPADEHIDAVARVVHRFVESHDRDEMVADLLTSTDPAVHEALAANLPADVMLAALVRAGVLTEELGVLALRPDGERWLAARFRTRGAAEAYCHLGAGLAVAHRHVTPWEVAP